VHIPTYVLPVLSQVQNGIAYQLAGTVISDVSSALHTTHLDAKVGQILAGDKYVVLISSSPESYHWRVFDQDQRILDETIPSGSN